MKKVILTAVAAVSFVSGSFAASEEFENLSVWLSKYYCEQNNVEWVSTSDPRYGEMKAKGEGMFSLQPLTLQGDMYQNIKQEFPMNATLQAAVASIQEQKNAGYLALAQKYGYSSYDELVKNIKKDPQFKGIELSMLTQPIDAKFSQDYSTATNAYWAEFNKRYETAVIEAIKRIQENAKVMNSSVQK
jgi:hypothetical protein